MSVKMSAKTTKIICISISRENPQKQIFDLLKNVAANEYIFKDLPPFFQKHQIYKLIGGGTARSFNSYKSIT